LELATERVWMPSKLACCLSNLCMAAATFGSRLLLCCIDLSRRHDKLSSKWCLSARDRARAPTSNSAVVLGEELHELLLIEFSCECLRQPQFIMNLHFFLQGEGRCHWRQESPLHPKCVNCENSYCMCIDQV